jgi:hypothetical protein
LKHLERSQFTDEREMEAILADKGLVARNKRGGKRAGAKVGRLAPRRRSY